MKKFFYLLLLSVACFTSSCKKEDAIDALVGDYTFVEEGSINYGSSSTPYSDNGTFHISRVGDNRVLFTGGLKLRGTSTDGHTITIEDSEREEVVDGYRMLFHLSYSNAEVKGKSFSCRVSGTVVVSAGSQSVTGQITSKITGYR